MAALPPLIHYLDNVKRWIWLTYLAAFFVFMGIIAALDAMSAPGTPANELVTWANGWLFLLPVGLIGYGFYVSARYWRCPGCNQYLPTKSYQTIPVHCRRCGAQLRG
jgi:hypothetical protein